MSILKEKAIIYRSVSKGANIAKCVDEAIKIAVQEECDVIFKFNDIDYTISYTHIVDEVYKNIDKQYSEWRYEMDSK